MISIIEPFLTRNSKILFYRLINPLCSICFIHAVSDNPIVRPSLISTGLNDNLHSLQYHRRRSSSAVTYSSHPNFPFLLLRSEEHTSELQSLAYLVCRLLLEKKKIK